MEPFFDSYEARRRVTSFEKNFNIKEFIFSTPFTPDGNPHGELKDQYKRKTILETEKHFPYVKTRIEVLITFDRPHTTKKTQKTQKTYFLKFYSTTKRAWI